MDFSDEHMAYKAEYYKVLPIKHNSPPPDNSDAQSDDSVVKMIKAMKESELQIKAKKKLTRKQIENCMPDYILKDNPDA